MTSPVQYFGCWQQVGHRLFSHEGYADNRITNPWGEWRDVDGTLAPRYASLHRYDPGAPHPEGHAKLHHKDGWTALAFWDYSVDRRGNSNSAFFIEGTHSFDEAVALATKAYPQTWARFNFKVISCDGQ